MSKKATKIVTIFFLFIMAASVVATLVFAR